MPFQKKVREPVPELPSAELTPAELTQASDNGGDYMDAVGEQVREELNDNAGRGETLYRATDDAGNLLAHAEVLSDFVTNGFVTVYRAPHGERVVLSKEHIGDYLKKPIDVTRWPTFAAQNRRAFYPRPQAWFVPADVPQHQCEFCSKKLSTEESRIEHMRGTHRSSYRLSVLREEREAREETRRHNTTLAAVLTILAETNQETKAKVDGLLAELGVKSP